MGENLANLLIAEKSVWHPDQLCICHGEVPDVACNVMQTHCMEKGSRRFLLEQLNVSGWKLVKIGKGLCGKFDDEDYSNQLGRPAPCPQNGDDDRSTFAAELSRSRTPDGVLHKKYDEGDYNDNDDD